MRIYAGFLHQEAATAALQAVRGITSVDVYAPYDAQDLVDRFAAAPRLGPIVLGAGLAGAALAFFSQAWVAAGAYPIRVGGRPFFDAIGFAPVALEAGLLAAIVAAVIGTIVTARLPALDDAIFAADPARTLAGRFVVVFAFDAGRRDALLALLRDHGAGPLVEVP